MIRYVHVHVCAGYTSTEWREEILPNKVFVLIGGHHRAGTTLLWDMLRHQPESPLHFELTPTPPSPSSTGASATPTSDDPVSSQPAPSPRIVAFGTAHATGADYSEGVFLQDILPHFGLGMQQTPLIVARTYMYCAAS